MQAILKIYKDCSSDEPTKTYECKRLLYGVSKKALTIFNEMKDKNQDEQVEYLIDFLQTVFPEFQAEEFDFVDTVELLQFVNAIAGSTNAELNKSRKN